MLSSLLYGLLIRIFLLFSPTHVHNYHFIYSSNFKNVKRLHVVGLTVPTSGSTVELQLSGLIGTARHPDMHPVRIIGFFFENWLHWPFEIRVLLFTVYTCV
jgi:hypothetical protein